MIWLACLSSAYGQSFKTMSSANESAVTPAFVPAAKSGTTGFIVPASYQPAKPPAMNPRAPATFDDGGEYVGSELPGPQRLFIRESETQFYDRIRQELKRQPGNPPAIFPEEPIISKESFVEPAYPRIDPVTEQPFAHMDEHVEPGYVCHRRLFFEQPNFERIGWDLGILQPGICLGVFYYDMFLLPYHMWTDPIHQTECNIGKCLPGDQAPLLFPVERFSVTGVIGEAAAIIGTVYLFP